MAVLKAAATNEKAYEAYLIQRTGYRKNAGYFVDCANFFYGQGDALTGRRVLSSVLELGIDTPPLLRVVAYRLAEAGDLDLAIDLLKDVRELRPEEPQSHRDLALLLAQRAELIGKQDSRSACFRLQ